MHPGLNLTKVSTSSDELGAGGRNILPGVEADKFASRKSGENTFGIRTLSKSPHFVTQVKRNYILGLHTSVRYKKHVKF